MIGEGRVRTMNLGLPAHHVRQGGPAAQTQAHQQRLHGQARQRLLAGELREVPVCNPVEAFAEAEGPKGAKTRTWISLPNQHVFAVAGIWRWSEQWGEAYSMVMNGACVHINGIHDSMRSSWWGAGCVESGKGRWRCACRIEDRWRSRKPRIRGCGGND